MTGAPAIRPAREDDLPRLLDLHRRVFGRPVSAGERRWKLAGQPAPVANVWVAEIGGRVVAQYAGIPVRVRHRGREAWAVQTVEAMTEPEQRRRGLISQISAAAFASWRRAGVAYRFGLPNRYWNARADAHGFLRVAELRWWVRWLDPARAFAARLGLDLPAGARAAPPTFGRSRGGPPLAPIADPAPLDDLWARTADEGVVRDAGWYRWRYREAPRPFELLGAGSGSSLDGVIAFRAEARSGTIAEVHGVEPRIVRRLLQGACAELRSQGAVRAALLIQTGTPLEEQALATGFLPRPHAFVVRALDLGGGLPRAARFQGGDFDVV
ncbi:MAG TPA: GNAT family N-acetyltransferase [Polyangia bacterium]|nr:GNAT family N-acetyltransferase [Polyangia bacterium]